MEDSEDMESSNTISNNWRPNDYDVRSMYTAPPSTSQQEYSSQEICTQRDPPLSQMGDADSTMDVQRTEPPPPPKPWARLICKTSELPSYELFPIPADSENRHNAYLIGRSSQCSIKIETSARISNRHCLIYCRENLADKQNPYLECWVEDLSANGTYLNTNTRLVKHTPRLLRSGDELHLINPALVHIPGSNVNNQELLRNTYLVSIDLPMPHAQSMRVTRAQTVSRGLLQEVMGRSNTIVRLLNQDRSIREFYEMKQELGRGTSGVVYLGIQKATGREWAIKCMDMRRLLYTGDIHEVTKEAEMLRSLRHENIIHLEDIFAENHTLFLVMELSKGGDLFDRIAQRKKYPEDRAKQVLFNILQALAYMHARKVAHRDLKPENILLVSQDDDCALKLTDFGLAKVQDDQQGGLKSFCGTPQYFAPEVLQRRSTVQGLGSYTIQADMWSVGVILYVLLVGAYPFTDGGDMDMDVQILGGRYNTTPLRGVSRLAKDLLAGLLEVNADTRLTAAQALQHAWFKDLRRARGLGEEDTTIRGIAMESDDVRAGDSNAHVHSTSNSNSNSGMPPPPPSTTKTNKRGQKRTRG